MLLLKNLTRITTYEGWFRQLLPLMLVQLVPLVGQVLLLGYGLSLSRALQAEQTTLPPLRWWQMLRQGSLLAITGLVYLAPIMALIPNIVLLEVGLRFLGLEPAAGSAAAWLLDASIALFMALLTSFVWLGWCVVGIRYALADYRFRVLINPNKSLKVLTSQRRTTLRLLLASVLSVMLLALATALGLLLLVLPGLLVLIVGWLSLYSQLTEFVLQYDATALHHEDPPPRRKLFGVLGRIN